MQPKDGMRTYFEQLYRIKAIVWEGKARSPTAQVILVCGRYSEETNAYWVGKIVL